MLAGVLDCPCAISPILLFTLLCYAPPQTRLFFGSPIPLQHPQPPPACATSFRKGNLGTSLCPLSSPPFLTLVPWNRGGWGGGAEKDPEVWGGEEKEQDGTIP